MPRAKSSKAKSARRKPSSEPVIESATPAADAASPASESGLIERYNAMAEELNGRGAMELAVPFYRQTTARLLAERGRWRARHAPRAVGCAGAARQTMGGGGGGGGGGGVWGGGAQVICAVTHSTCATNQ